MFVLSERASLSPDFDDIFPYAVRSGPHVRGCSLNCQGEIWKTGADDCTDPLQGGNKRPRAERMVRIGDFAGAGRLAQLDRGRISLESPEQFLRCRASNCQSEVFYETAKLFLMRSVFFKISFLSGFLNRKKGVY